jgi:catechol 2,3-dioxygenase-like lactoylglutathione lyase family enzyme
MITRFDHVTVAVRDVEKAKAFFALLGFEEDRSVVISGLTFARYMGVDGIEAEHVTLVLARATPRLEVQLLKYRHPEPRPDPEAGRLDRLGFNHVCFAVDDLDGMVAMLREHGIRTRSEVLDFHRRKLVFLVGPEDVTVELSQWY